jgi:hypothetical protein
MNQPVIESMNGPMGGVWIENSYVAEANAPLQRNIGTHGADLTKTAVIDGRDPGWDSIAWGRGIVLAGYSAAGGGRDSTGRRVASHDEESSTAASTG